MKTTISICYSALWLFQLISIISRLQAQPDDGTYLIMANRPFVRKIELSNFTIDILHNNTRSSILGLDLDTRTREVFWSDVFQHTIMQADLSGSVVKTLVSEEIMEPVGVAWDWISKKLYWVDSSNRTLEVIDPSTGYRKALYRFQTTEPRAIVLDPIRKWIYWSAWSDEANQQDGQIVRTSMDGKTSTVLFDESQVVWPNGLTLDLESQTLYWVDALKDTISQSKADGSNPQILVDLNTTAIADKWHSFGLDYFNGQLYFGNWLNDSVFSFKVNSSNSTLTRVVQLTTDPGSLRVVDQRRQPSGENPCEVGNGGCTHLCLLSTVEPSGYSCVCPDETDSQDCTYFSSSVAVNAELTETGIIVIEPHINEGIECSIRDELLIRATATNSRGIVVSTRYVSFTNDPIFISVPSGEYSCSIEIVTPSNVTHDTRRILCSTKEASQLFLIVVIALSGSTLVALLVGFSAGLFALQCWMKRRRERKSNKKLTDTSEKLSVSKIVKMPDPHYEELPKRARNSIPLETNVAYGQNSIGRHSLAVSYSSESNTLV